MTARTHPRALGWLTVAGLAAVALAAPTTTLATQPNPDHKVTICHRTDSQTNPYVQITVDVASVDGIAGNDNGQGDHLLEHQGDVWYPGHAKEPKWGDIIPALYADGTPDGMPSLNWNAAGQAIFNNGCNPVDQSSSSPSDSPSSSPSDQPSNAPSGSPSGSPSGDPSSSPSGSPSGDPSSSPSSSPSGSPSASASDPVQNEPSGTPSSSPSSSASTDPTSTPKGAVLGTTGTPQLTPPPTDSTIVKTASTGNGWQLIVLAAAGVVGSLLALTPAVARKRR